MQVCPRLKLRKCLSLKLDNQHLSSFKSCSSPVAQTDSYLQRLNRFFCSVFFQSVIMYLGFLFSQLQTYKRIILRAIKGDTSCTSVEQSLFMQIVTKDRIFPSSSLLCRSCCICASQGFVIKHLLDLHRLDELKNFAAKNLLQLVIQVAYWDPHNWLVTYWGSCITRRDCHYRTSPIRYWGKSSTVGW